MTGGICDPQVRLVEVSCNITFSDFTEVVVPPDESWAIVDFGNGFSPYTKIVEVTADNRGSLDDAFAVLRLTYNQMRTIGGDQPDPPLSGEDFMPLDY